LNQEFPGYNNARLNDDVFKPLFFEDSKEKVNDFRKVIFQEIADLDEKKMM
jgi:hypothetical protein